MGKKIAGRYTVTYGGIAMGETADGITIEHFVNKQLITGDNEGLTPQDAVYQGHECFVEMTLLEFTEAGALLAYWPYDTEFGIQGAVGRMDVDSSIVAALVMTAVSGTTAADSGSGGGAASPFGNTLTADRAILAEGFPVRMLYGPGNIRDVPLRFRLYPNASSQFLDWTTV